MNRTLEEVYERCQLEPYSERHPYYSGKEFSCRNKNRTDRNAVVYRFDVYSYADLDHCIKIIVKEKILSSPFYLYLRAYCTDCDIKKLGTITYG